MEGDFRACYVMSCSGRSKARNLGSVLGHYPVQSSLKNLHDTPIDAYGGGCTNFFALLEKGMLQTELQMQMELEFIRVLWSDSV